MYQTIKLPQEIINQAKIYGEVNSRSTPKQIEYWIKIGKIAEENPELSYSFIKDIMLGMAEIEDSDVRKFRLSEINAKLEAGMKSLREGKHFTEEQVKEHFRNKFGL